MEGKLVLCPKCGREQRGEVECLACGVVFAKYIEAQRDRQEQDTARKAGKNRAPKQQGGLFQAAILVVLTAIATYYFTRPAPSGSSPANPQTVQVRPAPVLPKKMAKGSEPEQPVVQQKDLPADSLAGSIERAQAATVSIETPWGVGSGFFISKNCIVTSRHVVQLDPSEPAKLRQKLEERKKHIDSARQTIAQRRAHLQQMRDWSGRREWEIQIEQVEQKLKTEMALYEEAECLLKKMESPIDLLEIKVILVDGSSESPSSLRMSEKHDLAVLSMLGGGPHVLQRPLADSPLHQGDKLYAVGSPVGLRNTVTAGIYSGRQKRESDGEVFLQTDAPINPGNSGGPLIDEKGFVRGVNTMILKNTEGIGFAIPIERVFEDLGFYVY